MTLRTNLPEDISEAIETVVGHNDYSVYVLDGQTSQITGDQDDWHDALVLIEQDSTSQLADNLVKFTLAPSGQIEYYFPNRPDIEPVTLSPQS